VIELVKIPNNKSQRTNKSQHAAQAPALRVTKIQNHKQKNNSSRGASAWAAR
jgi:predicted Fe-Mo cluster-binding NifX family protein